MLLVILEHHHSGTDGAKHQSIDVVGERTRLQGLGFFACAHEALKTGRIYLRLTVYRFADTALLRSSRKFKAQCAKN